MSTIVSWSFTFAILFILLWYTLVNSDIISDGSGINVRYSLEVIPGLSKIAITKFLRDPLESTLYGFPFPRRVIILSVCRMLGLCSPSDGQTDGKRCEMTRVKDVTGSFGRPDRSPEVLCVRWQLMPRLREFQPMDKVRKSIAGGTVCYLFGWKRSNMEKPSEAFFEIRFWVLTPVRWIDRLKNWRVRLQDRGSTCRLSMAYVCCGYPLRHCYLPHICI